MQLKYFVLFLAVFGMVFAAGLTIDVIAPTGDVLLYEDDSFNASVDVTCGDEDCNEVNVSLFYAAPPSCQDILGLDPTAPDGIYAICPIDGTCMEVYCDMGNGGWASIFFMEGDLELDEDSRDCILNNDNDDMDSTILWADLSTKVAAYNFDYTYGQDWFTWERDGTEDMSMAYLPDRPSGMGDYARPVPLPATGKTVWFDWENEEIIWDTGSASFADVGLGNIFNDSVWNSPVPYFISDGVNMIHVGEKQGSQAWLLVFNFNDDTVSGTTEAVLSPPNGWWGTEEDTFDDVLYTVNGRVMYFDTYTGDGIFALGGGMDDPNSQYDTYTVTAWANPSQPGLDFFARVDNNNYLWFGDWGHDNGGYFACGNDNYFGVAKTNIMLTYNGTFSASGVQLVPESSGTPYYTTDSNPQAFTLLSGENVVVNYTVFATEPSRYIFFATANQTGSPYLGNISAVWSVESLERVPPIPIQAAPRDNYYSYPDTISLEFACDEGIIDTIELWSDASGTWAMEYSSSSYSEGDVISEDVDFSSLGTYNWSVFCNATYGGSAWSPNRTAVIVDNGTFECQILDSADTTYTLLTDIYAEAGSSCLDVDAENVVIDCAGHSIIGTGCNSGESGVYSDELGTVVRNCTIYNFCNDIFFNLGSGSGLIEHNNLSEADYGLNMQYSDYNQVLYNLFLDNDFGFYLYEADYNQIGRNTITETVFANLGAGSCPFLYLWNGGGYEYYTDLASEVIGKPKYETPLYEAGIYELGDFKPEDGTYKMKIREVIPESDFVDELKLMIVDVPEGYGVLNQWHNTYSDDMAPPKEFMTIKDPREPLSATDRYGNDVLAEVSANDGVPLPMETDTPNWVIVDFGAIENPEYAKLVISGWSAYGTKIQEPSQENLLIETMNAEGEWEEAKRFGKFTGDSRTFVFDIAGILDADDTRMRITSAYSRSNAKIIDQILLDDSEPVAIEVAEVDPSVADLHWGGATNFEYTSIYSRISATDEKLPNNEDYLMYGNFTRYGDVRALLGETDDIFAIMRHGDELQLEFADIPPAEGKDRHVFLKADVMYSVKYSGGGDFVSDSVALMPFHGMSQYPYGDGESYPYDAEHTAYIQDWNTREYLPPEKFGGSLPYSYNNTVFENVFTGGANSIALYLDNEDSTSILDNNISEVYQGIYLYYSVYTLVRGNNVFTSSDALYLTDSSNNQILGNVLDSESGEGIYMTSSSSSNEIINNTISSEGEEGLDVYDSDGSIITGNSIYSGQEEGLGLYESEYSVIRGNNISSVDGRGMALRQGSNNSQIIGNIISSDNTDYCDFSNSNNCGAVFFGNSGHNLFEDNNISAIHGTGMYFGYSYYNEVYGNRITSTDGYYSLYITKSSNENTFQYNNITSDYWVIDEVGGNIFSDSTSGNIYYLADGTPSWDVFDIEDTNGDGWANAGADLPFSCATVGDCGAGYTYWSNNGEDEHPYTLNGETPPSSDGGSSTKSLSWSWGFDCESGELTVSNSDEESGIAVRLLSTSGPAMQEQDTDSDGAVVFRVTADGTYKIYQPSDGQYLSYNSAYFGLALCGEVIPEEVPEEETPEEATPPEEEQPPEDEVPEPEGPTQEEASDAIDDALSAINGAANSGKDTSAAQAKLDEANAAFAAGNYEEAIALAEEAKQLALNAAASPIKEVSTPKDVESTPTPQPSAQAPAKGMDWLPLLLLGLLALILVGGAALYFFMKGKEKPKFKK